MLGAGQSRIRIFAQTHWTILQGATILLSLQLESIPNPPVCCRSATLSYQSQFIQYQKFRCFAAIFHHKIYNLYRKPHANRRLGKPFIFQMIYIQKNSIRQLSPVGIFLLCSKNGIDSQTREISRITCASCSTTNGFTNGGISSR
jgi:hypothetical protein